MINKFSVLMSIYYKEDPVYFKESINSVLNQTIVPDEIVIVKDGELTQKLDDILKDLKNNSLFKIIALEKNVGLGKALNIGINHCDNEIIARMDTDDIARTDRFEKQLKVLHED